jgi:hypothetical protein
LNTSAGIDLISSRDTKNGSAFACFLLFGVPLLVPFVLLFVILFFGQNRDPLRDAAFNAIFASFMLVYYGYLPYFRFVAVIYGIALAFARYRDDALKDMEKIEMSERTWKHFNIEQQRSAKRLTELQAREIGGRIVAEAGATVYNNSFNNSTVVDCSTLINSTNRVENDGQLADALQIVAGIIQNFNNSIAIQTLHEFNKDRKQREQDYLASSLEPNS